MIISFRKADVSLQPIIFSWLEEPHMKEFWDNSLEHKNDILNFIEGRKQTYFAGSTKYWVGFVDNEPFCFILSDQILSAEKELHEIYRKYLSAKGNTIALDFGIGNIAFLGKGLAAKALAAFMEFYRTKIDSAADTFFIDPAENNPRAQHVYEKAGFKLVGDYVASEGAFIGKRSLLMICRFA